MVDDGRARARRIVSDRGAVAGVLDDDVPGPSSASSWRSAVRGARSHQDLVGADDEPAGAGEPLGENLPQLGEPTGVGVPARRAWRWRPPATRGASPRRGRGSIQGVPVSRRTRYLRSLRVVRAGACVGAAWVGLDRRRRRYPRRGGSGARPRPGAGRRPARRRRARLPGRPPARDWTAAGRRAERPVGHKGADGGRELGGERFGTGPVDVGRGAWFFLGVWWCSGGLCGPRLPGLDVACSGRRTGPCGGATGSKRSVTVACSGQPTLARVPGPLSGHANA